MWKTTISTANCPSRSIVQCCKFLNTVEKSNILMKLYNKNYICIFMTLFSLWTRVRIIFGIIRGSRRGTGWGRIWTRLCRTWARRTGLGRTSPGWLIGLRTWFSRSWFWASTFGFLRPTRLRARRGLLHPRRRSWWDSLFWRCSGWNLLSRRRPFGFLLHIRLFFGSFLFLWGFSFGLLFHDGLCFPMNDPVSRYKMLPLASFYYHWKKRHFWWTNLTKNSYRHCWRDFGTVLQAIRGATASVKIVRPLYCLLVFPMMQKIWRGNCDE